MSEDQLDRIEAKLDAIIAAMDYATSEPEPGRHTFWRTMAKKDGKRVHPMEASQDEPKLASVRCVDCKQFGRDSADMWRGWCYASDMIVHGNFVKHCKTYEPTAEPDPKTTVCCKDCRHWTPERNGDGWKVGWCAKYRVKFKGDPARPCDYCEPKPAVKCCECRFWDESCIELTTGHCTFTNLTTCGRPSRVCKTYRPKAEARLVDCELCRHWKSFDGKMGTCHAAGLEFAHTIQRCVMYEPTS